jgi:hypothetical protein
VPAHKVQRCTIFASSISHQECQRIGNCNVSATAATANLEDQRAQRIYRGHVLDVVAQIRQIFDKWVALREIEPDYARLANTAAVNRWELMRLVERIDRLQPPRVLNSAHRTMLTSVTASARACQLLAVGYRFHKSEAICDGQSLLLETVQDLDDLIVRVDAR